MNRRAFLGSLVGGVAAAAAVRTWPFRVFSFPAEPKIVHATISEYKDYVNFSELVKPAGSPSIYYDRTLIPHLKGKEVLYHPSGQSASLFSYSF